MKRLKIFKTPWHIAHDHDLIMALKDYADFGLLHNYTRRWDDKNRPLPENTFWTTHFEKGVYDLAILNLDQQCTIEGLNKGVLTKQMYKTIKEVEPDLPVVFINHGTPVYPERLEYSDGNSKNGYISEVLKKEILKMVDGNPMVVNSHQAEKDWGYDKTKVIIHGMNPDEWIYCEDREPRVCAFISAGGIGDKYYNRSYLIAVMQELKERYGISLQWINSPGCYKANGIKDYKEFLGKSLIFFNGTFASPMPRSRTEAMLSGCCIITTPQHDADTFIKHGENGFIISHKDVYNTAKLIAELLSDYKTAKMVGRKGRETAIKIFNRERYKNDWVNFLKELKIL